MNFAISECLAKESKQTIIDYLIDKTLVEMRETNKNTKDK